MSRHLTRATPLAVLACAAVFAAQAAAAVPALSVSFTASGSVGAAPVAIGLSAEAAIAQRPARPERGADRGKALHADHAPVTADE